jgi:hypothetical protein
MTVGSLFSMHTTHPRQALACLCRFTTAGCSTVSVLPQATVAEGRCSSMHTTHLTQAFACPTRFTTARCSGRYQCCLKRQWLCGSLFNMHTAQSHTGIVHCRFLHSSILAGISAASSDSGCRGRCSTCTQLPQYRRQRPSQIHSTRQQRYRAPATVAVELVVPACTAVIQALACPLQIHCSSVQHGVSAAHQHSGCSARCSSMHRSVHGH